MLIHSAVARHVCILLGYLYPALASAKTAVQQDPKAFTQWMTYWVVMSVFGMAEILFDFFVSWVPFYFEAKIVLIVWLTLPRYQGASQIYARLLHPYMVHYEGEIDNGLEGMRVEATRRIQSLSATAASEIAKAVTQQGTTVKEQLFSRVLGVAVAGSGNAVDDRGAVRSAPPSPMPRRVYEAAGDDFGTGEGSGLQEGDGTVEHDHEANATMLLDFLEIMKGGVFVKARASFLRGDSGEDSWRPRRIRSLHGRHFCITDTDEAEEPSESFGNVTRGGGVDAGAGMGGRFEVLAARADASSGEGLMLETDRGMLELSLPACDDRDTLLMGFGLLLAPSSILVTSNNLGSPTTIIDSNNMAQEFTEGRGRNSSLDGEERDEILSGKRGSFERRDFVRIGGQGHGERTNNMAISFSSDDDSDSDGGDDALSPPASISPLRRSWAEVE